MVETVGSKPVSIAGAAVSRLAQTAPTPTVQAGIARKQDAATIVSGTTASMLAAAPPVDVERVALIKKAIADGTFPIQPATIADRMMALKLEWSPNDQA
ncbi:hypothetical protein ASE75_00280 [Sphingomonas sp. Leaf17]|uniref:flagellar biosynthesis anti-sigma factor FlgM n=1 Tax=Sphingomonas sp. Leaf17 TaxID=1735683 RepID=UPI0006F336EF|nr:flagellar biosynthesis anti-sigma factor FlgM [Sphingomonas sp. Leaf17]KQM67438.1 hypothetical protein ASE75_00280 [Sphingomonas sp. Leaf17]